MKKKLTLLFSLISTSLLFSQVGINTNTPTKMLDVNGDMRVRVLDNVLRPNVLYVVSTDINGNFYKTTPLDIMYSSGVFVKSNSDNQWNNIRIGTKGTQLNFIGRANINTGVDFTFSIFYDKGGRITKIYNPIIENNYTISLTDSNTNSFTVTISNGSVNRGFVFTISEPNNTSSFSNITVTNSESISVNGSFYSLFHS